MKFIAIFICEKNNYITRSNIHAYSRDDAAICAMWLRQRLADNTEGETNINFNLFKVVEVGEELLAELCGFSQKEGE